MACTTTIILCAIPTNACRIWFAYDLVFLYAGADMKNITFDTQVRISLNARDLDKRLCDLQETREIGTVVAKSFAEFGVSFPSHTKELIWCKKEQLDLYWIPVPVDLVEKLINFLDSSRDDYNLASSLWNILHEARDAA